MSSTFYIVHHELKVGKAEKWWEAAYAAMSPGGGWDDAVAANKEKGFYNLTFSFQSNLIESRPKIRGNYFFKLCCC